MKKTTWNDYHNGNVEKRETPAGRYIAEACGRSRVETHCPFCGEEVVVFIWHPEKRCTKCGAMIAGTMSFKVREEEENG